MKKKKKKQEKAGDERQKKKKRNLFLRFFYRETPTCPRSPLYFNIFIFQENLDGNISGASNWSPLALSKILSRSRSSLHEEQGAVIYFEFIFNEGIKDFTLNRLLNDFRYQTKQKS